MPDKSETQIVQQKMNLKEVVDPEGNSLRDGYICVTNAVTCDIEWQDWDLIHGKSF